MSSRAPEDDPISQILSYAFEPAAGEDVPDREDIRNIIRRAAASPPAGEEERAPGPDCTRATGDERYDAIREISRGGMGVVREMRDSVLGRRIAVKTLAPEYRDSPGRIRRFVEEAQICGQLEHPGIVAVHDFGFLEDGSPYFTMKLIGGKTLAQLLGEREGIEADAGLLRIFHQICQTVAYAHDRGVLHRDLKPSNVMVGEFGELQVMDWGLAKVLGSDEQPRDDDDEGVSTLRSEAADGSQAGVVLGTGPYMSPEQARGDVDAIDFRTDVFGLGAILVEILTGSPPYVAERADAVLELAAGAQLDDARRRLAEADADRALVSIASTCIAADPADRFASAVDLVEAIDAHMTSQKQLLRRAEVRAAEASARAESERRSRRMALALAATVVVAVTIVAFAFAWWDRDRRDREAADRQDALTALSRARTLGERARSPDAGAAAWADAIGAAHQAEVLATDETRDVARDLMARLERERRAWQTARAVARRLEAIAPDFDDDRGPVELDRQYRLAFADLRLDLAATSVEDAVAALKRSPVADELLVALDDWIWQLRRLPERANDDWAHLMRIAVRADSDAWRNRVRRASSTGDVDELRRLARDGELAATSPHSYDILAKGLHGLRAHDETRRVLRKAHLVHPEDPRISHNLGNLLLRDEDRDFQEIARLFQAAVSVRPRHAHYRCDLAAALSEIDQLDEALGVLELALEYEPRYARAWLAKSVIHWQRKDYEKALADLDRAVDVSPLYIQAHSNRAIVLAAMGRLEDALEANRVALEINPRFTKAVIDEARCLRRLGRPVEALPGLRAHLGRRPESFELRVELAGCLMSARRFHEAEPHLRALVKSGKGDRSMARANLAYCLLAQFRAAEALPIAKTLVDEYPRSPDAWNCLGMALLDTGSFKEGRSALRKAWELTKGDETTRARLRFDDTMPLALAFVDLEPDFEDEEPGESDDPFENVVLGMMCTARGQLLRAARFYDEALRLDEAGELGGMRRMRAIRAAAAVASSSDVAPADRARWRRRALTWFTATLDEIPPAKGDLQSHYRLLLFDASMAPLRDDLERTGIDEAERRAWASLWERMRAAL